MIRIVSSLLLLLLWPGAASAAAIGDRCELGTNVAPAYLCPMGTLCLKSITNRYCSNADRQCGWNDTSGYYLGQKKTYQGDEYVCTTQGFVKSTSTTSGGTPAPAPQASIGGECQIGTNVAPEYLCPIGTLCLQAISKKYCAHADKQCGWAGDIGYVLGATRSYGGANYVCTPTGFQLVASVETPSAVVAIPGVTDVPVTPMVRTLNRSEQDLLRTVYGSSINYAMVRITNTEGAADGAPWTTNTPPLYTVNVGVNCFVSFTRSDCRGGDGLALLVHELGHVWQGQHGVPFMSNSLFHQGKAVIEGGDRNRAYAFRPGGQWRSYNAEQQAEIVEAWYRAGRRTDSALYPYIRDNVRPGQPGATTSFK